MYNNSITNVINSGQKKHFKHQQHYQRYNYIHYYFYINIVFILLSDHFYSL